MDKQIKDITRKKEIYVVTEVDTKNIRSDRVKVEGQKIHVRMYLERDLFITNYRTLLEDQEDLKQESIELTEVYEGKIFKKEKISISELMLELLRSRGGTPRSLILFGPLKSKDLETSGKYKAGFYRKRVQIEGIELKMRVRPKTEERREKLQIELILEPSILKSRKEVNVKDILKLRMRGLNVTDKGKVTIQELLSKCYREGDKVIEIPKGVTGVEGYYNRYRDNTPEVKEIEQRGVENLTEGYATLLEVERGLNPSVGDSPVKLSMKEVKYKLSSTEVVKILKRTTTGVNILSLSGVIVNRKSIDKLDYNSKGVYTLKNKVDARKKRDVIYIKRYEGDDLEKLKLHELSQGEHIQILKREVMSKGLYYGCSEYGLSYIDTLESRTTRLYKSLTYQNNLVEGELSKISDEVKETVTDYEKYIEDMLNKGVTQPEIRSQLIEVEGKYYRLVREQYKG